ncbi:MAG: glucose-6-phosphate isomerase [Bacteroidia bacterium]|nr:glucose-6-phosphate isomerase [Bacteroidia bacterium]
MNDLKISIDRVFDFVSENEIQGLFSDLEVQNKALHEKTGKGNEFLGWVNLPSSTTNDEIQSILTVVEDLRSEVEYIVVIGIGGSYLGSKAVTEALSDSFHNNLPQNGYPHILFAGHQLSEDYHYELLDFLKDRQFGVIVISKSGTTTEPAIAFRLLRNEIERKLGREKAAKRIIAVTDAAKGVLRSVADREGYKTFIIPDDVGGRYSVLTPVGLLPVAMAGFDIRRLMDGARKMEEISGLATRHDQNPCMIYAAARYALFRNYFEIEMLVNYHPKLHFLADWWKQLFGESEGKDQTGIFPAAADLTTDLHSMGQYIQEGRRNIFETVISVVNTRHILSIPEDSNDEDKLNFLSGKRISEVNRMAELGTCIAHVEGGVPVIRIEIPRIDEYYLGQLIYFFEKACGLSGYLLGVNPFDQPGVEAYKNNMFALLGKPGYEKLTEEIRKGL